jgi:hypothetical protein
MGFFLAANRKPYGTAHIFTIQGTNREIVSLLPSLLNYLNQAGGTRHCKLKEERLADYWVSDDVVLPPVIDTIDWLSGH